MKVQKKYYLSPALVRRSRVQAAKEGITQSAFLERALRNFLKDTRRKP